MGEIYLHYYGAHTIRSYKGGHKERRELAAVKTTLSKTLIIAYQTTGLQRYFKTYCFEKSEKTIKLGKCHFMF